MENKKIITFWVDENTFNDFQKLCVQKSEFFRSCLEIALFDNTFIQKVMELKKQQKENENVKNKN